MQQLNIQHSLWSFSARTYYTFRPLSLLTELLTKVVNDKHHRTSVQQTHWECYESHSGFQRPENNFWLLEPSISPWNCFHKFWLACLFRTRTQAPVLLSIDQNKTNTSGRQKKARERQRFCFSHSGFQLCPGLMFLPQQGGRKGTLKTGKGRKLMVPSVGSHPVEHRHAHHACPSPPACR